jgi:hypothetical protein
VELEPEPYRVIAFDYQGEAAEIAEIVNREAARRHARTRSKQKTIAYATIVDKDRLDVFAYGKNRLRIKRPKAL